MPRSSCLIAFVTVCNRFGFIVVDLETLLTSIVFSLVALIIFLCKRFILRKLHKYILALKQVLVYLFIYMYTVNPEIKGLHVAILVNSFVKLHLWRTKGTTL